jgi:diguanylate cyclase (GGDEF)-like protein
MGRIMSQSQHVSAQGALEVQLATGWRSLRFAPDLESGFRQQYRIWALPFRLALIVIAAVLIAVTPLLDLWVLHPPEGFMRPAHFSQLGVMLPVLMVAGLCTAVPALRRWSDATAMVAVLVVAGGLLFQRTLGARYGVWLPTELITVTVAGAYVMGGLGFWRMTPLAVLLLAAIAAAEIHSYGNSATSHYIIFGITVQILIAGLAGYLQEHFARGTWLRGELLAILATQDSLTGLLNFRAFEERAAALFAVAERERKAVLVAVLDLDYFKQFNDAYGHAAGNACLRCVANFIAAELRRDADIKARMGGEEFVLVLYDVEHAEAARRMEALRAGVEALAIPHQGTPLTAGVVTASIGAHWCEPANGATVESALQHADYSVYAAKAAGRNRVAFERSTAS